MGATPASPFRDRVEFFGRRRLIQAFAKGGASADEVAQNVLWELRKFVGISRRADDVTMIAAKVV